MAKKNSHSLSPRPNARPIIIRTPAPIVKVHKKRHARRGGGGGFGGARGLMSRERMGIVLGAFVVGLLEKQGIMASLPTLPLIGRTGTIGVGAYLLSDGGKNRLADEVCTAALVLAAHELSSTGHVLGGAGDPGQGGYVPGR